MDLMRRQSSVQQINGKLKAVILIGGPHVGKLYSCYQQDSITPAYMQMYYHHGSAFKGSFPYLSFLFSLLSLPLTPPLVFLSFIPLFPHFLLCLALSFTPPSRFPHFLLCLTLSFTSPSRGCISGTRFRPLSLELPQPLFPIAGSPWLQHHIEAIVKVYTES